MKKTYVAAIAILAASAIVLAAAVALLQYQPSQVQSNSGKLAVMGTDPPVYSEEVRNATAHYNSVSAHKSGSDMSTGWVQVQGSGTLDLFASGTAQTMAVAQVDSGAYDAFRFNVDSVQVNYNGQWYAAAVASSTLTAQSTSRVQVASNSTAAAVVDLRTFIENTASTSTPQFVFSATAVATAVPPATSATISLNLNLGTRVDLSSQAWWSSFVASTSTNLSVAATLSSGSMTLDLQNSGGAAADVQEVIITPVSAGVFATTSLPSSLSGSAVFTVSGSGSVQQSSSLQGSALLNGGATVASGASSTLNYSGDINLNSVAATGVVAGQQYIVTCIGANTYASTTVVAT